MSKKITATHERVDDIPAIIAYRKNRRGAALLDNHCPPNGHWQGLRLGQTTVVWLACILSAGDHRLSRVAPWGTAHQRTLRRCLGSEVQPRALTDDRLATPLDDLSGAERWAAFARDLTPSMLRVSDWQGRVVRGDPTTAGASVTPAGLCQLGHRKAHRPDLPQVKSAMAVLDPLGWPLTTPVVAGHTADAPLYLPERATVRPTAPRTGLTYVGDCQMAAMGTRAELVAHQDSSWGPLSAQQRPEADRDRVLDPGLRDVLEPSAIRLPHADGALAEPADPVAMGVGYTVERRAPAQSGQAHTWNERRLVVRALAFATPQAKHLRQRGARAVPESNARDARQQGQQRVPDEATAYPAAAALMAQPHGEGLVHVTVMPAVHAHVNRRYGPRPAPTGRSERVRVGAAPAEAPLAHAVRRLGWRV
jgi:hypothetical protein